MPAGQRGERFEYGNGNGGERWGRQISLVNFTLYVRLQEETTSEAFCALSTMHNKIALIRTK